jgi:hypothetical protein
MAVVIATCGVAAVGVELAAHGRFGVRRGLAAARERRG